MRVLGGRLDSLSADQGAGALHLGLGEQAVQVLGEQSVRDLLAELQQGLHLLLHAVRGQSPGAQPLELRRDPVVVGLVACNASRISMARSGRSMRS